MGQLIERRPGQQLMVGTAIVTVLRIDGATASVEITHLDLTKRVHTLSINESRMVGPRMGVTFRGVRQNAGAILYVQAPPDVAIVVPDRNAR
jgi:sRNA-binding carbon storage regulator CsrA